jgi:hypothetical protein
MKFPIKIRLYPNSYQSSGLYALAHIWPDVKAVHKASNTPMKSKDTAAFCCGVEHIDITTNKKAPIFAELHFPVTHLYEHILSHEVLHAAIQWQHRVKLNKAFMFSGQINDYEEAFCYAQSRMLWQLVCRLNKLGLYK